MKLVDLKGHAEKFRDVADDSVLVGRLADALVNAYPNDPQVLDLCTKIRNARDGDSVRTILDEVKARK